MNKMSLQNLTTLITECWIFSLLLFEEFPYPSACVCFLCAMYSSNRSAIAIFLRCGHMQLDSALIEAHLQNFSAHQFECLHGFHHNYGLVIALGVDSP